MSMLATASPSPHPSSFGMPPSMGNQPMSRLFASTEDRERQSCTSFNSTGIPRITTSDPAAT
ncbi:hypothetical protein NW765_014815 [Fusarium oxysporum]|nr:hypothetical protein NW765_014815 [Fusarium oxysporum]